MVVWKRPPKTSAFSSWEPVNVTLCSIRCVSGEDWGWGDCPELSQWAVSAITSVLVTGQHRETCRSKEGRVPEAESSGAAAGLGMEEGPRADGQERCRRSPGKAGGRYPLSTHPCHTLTAAQRNWFRASDLQNCKRISCLVFSHQICGRLLQQPWETNTQRE